MKQMEKELTVVRIHMRQATLAPMAHAPATPPRAADEAALFNTSRKPSVFSSVVVLLMFVLFVCIFSIVMEYNIVYI